MRHYTHLSIEEREKLYLRRGQGAKLREIARELGRSVSTISRELKRNERPRHPYSPSQAQKRYEKRRKACGRKHILCEAEKREYIRRFIQEDHWSPEQISNRLKLESAEVQISYAAIYRAIKAGIFDENKRAASRNKKKAFAYHLRRKGKKQRRQRDRKRQGSHFCDADRICDRPPEADDRSELGHAEATRDAMTALLGALPEDKVKSVTPDRGTEFTLYREISKTLRGLPFYFADPHSPWQRGTNENTNGLIREFIPKGTDLAHVPADDVAHLVALLNLRPRKCLDWRSPLEIFFNILLHLT